MKKTTPGYKIAVINLCMMIFAGCVTATSAPTRFYLLSSLTGTKTTSQSAGAESCFSMGVGPVKFPAYLDRPQIVTRIGPNELNLAEFDKWAEPLKDSFARTVVENISSLLCEEPIAVCPWRGATSIDYRLAVELIRFDGDLGKEVTLIVLWTIFGKNGRQMLVTKRSIYTEPVKEYTYRALVSAKSRAVAAFSRDVAAEIINILKKETKK